MEKKYSVKYIDVLYYDNKVLPVSLVKDKKGNKKLLFIDKNAKMDIETYIENVSTFNKGAHSIMTLRTVNQIKRYAEIGTLTSAIINYGPEGYTKFPKLLKVKKLVDEKNPVDAETHSKIAREYFETELTVEEIKTLFTELQKGYSKSNHRCSCPGRE